MKPSSAPCPTLYDDDTRHDLHDRPSKVEGQLKGVGRMIDGQRPAAEVLQQLASIRSAVKGITKGVVRAYLERSAAAAVRAGDAEAVEEMLDTLIKFVKE
jgi:DNA-binding FrmR family transcriptional regulator